MATKENTKDNRNQGNVMQILIIACLCGCFFLFGAWRQGGYGKGDHIAVEIIKHTDCIVISNLKYETHHDTTALNNIPNDDSKEAIKKFEPCDAIYSDFTPCHDHTRAMTMPRENMNYRERHCYPPEQRLHCLIPAPRGYATPFQWPKSRDYVPFANAPYKSLTIEKAVQNWIQYEGNVFKFPGGGTQFPEGADAYIDNLASIIPFSNGIVRTVLDTGCGVASLGAYLFKKNVITMSIAPRDSHEGQVQFALERGVPAIIGVLGTIKLPFPVGSYDMAHCSRCLIPWGGNDGKYMMEVDRVLRPGGYWVLSGPPINWRNNHRAWERPEEELEEEQRKIEEVAKLLCWEKKYEMGEIAIWRKSLNSNECRRQDSQLTICESSSNVWYKPMEKCVTPSLKGSDSWKPFSERLNAIPTRISNGFVDVSMEMYSKDNKIWKRHVQAYKQINKIIDSGRYRNIMDMNAGLGSFAAVLESPKLWVMNVVPTIAEKDTLGVIFERGLIGIYHDWCEAFSTYPRTYDLIHANGIFSLYKDKCNAEEILLEMDRILRPEGAVIFRDNVKVLVQVRRIVKGMRWNTQMVDGAHVSEKVLYAVKQYWVVGDN